MTIKDKCERNIKADYSGIFRSEIVVSIERNVNQIIIIRSYEEQIIKLAKFLNVFI